VLPKLISTNFKGGYNVTLSKGQMKNKEETIDFLIRDS
jgi:hypothetical protein